MTKNFCAPASCLVVFVVLSGPTVADQAKRRPIPPTERVQTILRDWEKASSDRSDIQVDFQLLRTGPLQKLAKTFETGTLVALRNGGTRIDLRDETGKPAAIYVWSNGQLRHFDYKFKVENVFVKQTVAAKPKFNPLAGVTDRLAERMAGLPERFRFGLFGIPATQAVERFNVRLLKEDAVTVTLAFEPLLDQDRADVKSIEIILDKMDYRPSRADIQSVIGAKFTIIPTEFLINRRPGADAVVLSNSLPTGWKRHFPLGGKNSVQNAN